MLHRGPSTATDSSRDSDKVIIRGFKDGCGGEWTKKGVWKAGIERRMRQHRNTKKTDDQPSATETARPSQEAFPSMTVSSPLLLLSWKSGRGGVACQNGSPYTWDTVSPCVVRLAESCMRTCLAIH